MSTFSPQRGASLLTILLLLAVVGSLVIAGSKALIDSSRSAAVISAKQDASQAARTGLNEGILYFNTNDPKLATCWGEYGTCQDRTGPISPKNYSLTPYRRGFIDADCTTPSANETIGINNSTINTNCPYYDLAIRDRVGYGTIASLGAFNLSTRDFPNNQPRFIAFRVPTTVTFNLASNPNITSVDYILCVSLASCGPQQGTILPNVPLPLSDPFYVKHYMRLTFHYTAQPNPPVTALTASMIVNSQIVLGKGYTTIEATGHVGDVQTRWLYVIRGDGTRYKSESIANFDAAGILSR